MTNGWYTVTETYVFGLAPSILMEWATLYDIDLDDDIESIKEQLINIMGKDKKDV